MYYTTGLYIYSLFIDTKIHESNGEMSASWTGPRIAACVSAESIFLDHILYAALTGMINIRAAQQHAPGIRVYVLIQLKHAVALLLFKGKRESEGRGRVSEQNVSH